MDGHPIDPVDTTSNWTPLLRLVNIEGSIEVAKLLIQYKANVNAVDNDKKSALVIAVLNGLKKFTKTAINQ